MVMFQLNCAHKLSLVNLLNCEYILYTAWSVLSSRLQQRCKKLIDVSQTQVCHKTEYIINGTKKNKGLLKESHNICLLALFYQYSAVTTTLIAQS